MPWNTHLSGKVVWYLSYLSRRYCVFSPAVFSISQARLHFESHPLPPHCIIPHCGIYHTSVVCCPGASRVPLRPTNSCNWRTSTAHTVGRSEPPTNLPLLTGLQRRKKKDWFPILLDSISTASGESEDSKQTRAVHLKKKPTPKTMLIFPERSGSRILVTL